MPLQCQAFFDIGSPARGLVTQGAIGFAEPQEEYWPFEQLNKMLEYFYNHTMDTPQICAAIESGVVVGYLAMSRNSYSQSQINDFFQQGVIKSECAVTTDDGFNFIKPTPFAAEADVNGIYMALEGYQQPAGPVLPLEAVNHVFRLLLGQQNWPGSLAPFLYPVSKNGSSELSGLWIGPTVNDLNDQENADDELFRGIRAFNNPGEASLTRRLVAYRALNAALSKYPDFQKKVFA